jgi:UDP-N-acetylmuramoyl-L-alanyl-D-glutamate--2,6-diaminopimelate ligase
MRLSYLLKAVKGYKLAGDPDPDITGLYYDSRRVKPGGLFVAIKGNALEDIFIQQP